MSVRCGTIPVIIGVLVLLQIISGCTTVSTGSAAYANGTLSLPVSNAGAPSAGFIQVTVYGIRDNRQEEAGTFFAPLSLERGENTAHIPVTLEPGQYKLYFYLIQDGERKAAVIRDIVVD